MKKYEIEINNEVYRVSVKELAQDADMSNSRGSEEFHSAAQSGSESTTRSTPTGKGTVIKAPMSGTILSIKVSSGQNVKQGDTLVVLEAMKMENEIVAPTNGVVGEILINANEHVESEQVLLTI